MLSDTKFIQEYIETNKQRIQKMYHSFVDGFKQLEIGCIESGAG
jgi:aminotransferase